LGLLEVMLEFNAVLFTSRPLISFCIFLLPVESLRQLRLKLLCFLW